MVQVIAIDSTAPDTCVHVWLPRHMVEAFLIH